MFELGAILLPVGLGLAAIYLLLPRPRGGSALAGGAIGAAALLMIGGTLVRANAVTVETIVFYLFSGFALVAGAMLVTQRNPARAALAFALVVLSTCGLFLLLAAPFLTAATTIIYAGAIVVTFLFVLMLAQQEGPADADLRSREPLLACLAGFVLLGALVFVLQRGYEVGDLKKAAGDENQQKNLSKFSGPRPHDKLRRDENQRPQLPAENVAYLGRSLFTDYLLPVELGGMLLLVATIGAIAIATRRGGRPV